MAGWSSILDDISLILLMYSSVFCIISLERISSLILFPTSILYILSGFLSVNSSEYSSKNSSSSKIIFPLLINKSVNDNLLEAITSFRAFHLMDPSVLMSLKLSSMISLLLPGGILASLSSIIFPWDSIKSRVSLEVTLN